MRTKLTIGIAIVCLLLLISSPAYAGYDWSLHWTRIGAIGSWVGSLFSFIALVIAIVALVMPYRVRLYMDFYSSFNLKDREELYEIHIGNTGARPVTISNVYLLVGKEEVPLQWMGKMLMIYFKESIPPVPRRLEQGQEMVVYLYKDVMLKDFSARGKRGRIGIKVDIAAEKNSRKHWTNKTVNSLMDGWVPSPDDEDDDDN